MPALFCPGISARTVPGVSRSSVAVSRETATSTLATIIGSPWLFSSSPSWRRLTCGSGSRPSTILVMDAASGTMRRARRLTGTGASMARYSAVSMLPVAGPVTEAMDGGSSDSRAAAVSVSRTSGSASSTPRRLPMVYSRPVRPGPADARTWGSAAPVAASNQAGTATSAAAAKATRSASAVTSRGAARRRTPGRPGTRSLMTRLRPHPGEARRRSGPRPAPASVRAPHLRRPARPR